MNFCCDTYTNLGCFGSCAPINTGILAPVIGTYKIFLQFNNAVSEITVVTTTVNEEIVLVDQLNENYIYKMKIFQVVPGPPETMLELGCYRFQTQFIHSIPTS